MGGSIETLTRHRVVAQEDSFNSAGGEFAFVGFLEALIRFCARMRKKRHQGAEGDLDVELVARREELDGCLCFSNARRMVVRGGP